MIETIESAKELLYPADTTQRPSYGSTYEAFEGSLSYEWISAKGLALVGAVLTSALIWMGSIVVFVFFAWPMWQAEFGSTSASITVVLWGATVLPVVIGIIGSPLLTLLATVVQHQGVPRNFYAWKNFFLKVFWALVLEGVSTAGNYTGQFVRDFLYLPWHVGANGYGVTIATIVPQRLVGSGLIYIGAAIIYSLEHLGRKKQGFLPEQKQEQPGRRWKWYLITWSSLIFPILGAIISALALFGDLGAYDYENFQTHWFPLIALIAEIVFIDLFISNVSIAINVRLRHGPLDWFRTTQSPRRRQAEDELVKHFILSVVRSSISFTLGISLSGVFPNHPGISGQRMRTTIVGALQQFFAQFVNAFRYAYLEWDTRKEDKREAEEYLVRAGTVEKMAVIMVHPASYELLLAFIKRVSIYKDGVKVLREQDHNLLKKLREQFDQATVDFSALFEKGHRKDLKALEKQFRAMEQLKEFMTSPSMLKLIVQALKYRRVIEVLTFAPQIREGLGRIMSDPATKQALIMLETPLEDIEDLNTLDALNTLDTLVSRLQTNQKLQELFEAFHDKSLKEFLEFLQALRAKKEGRNI